MPVRPINEAQTVIGPYVNDVVLIIGSAHSDYISVFGSHLHILEARTKASIVRDFIVDKLRKWADKTDGVQFFKNGNLCWFGFQNNWILRVKLLDDCFFVSVSPTEASQTYNRNEIPDNIRDSLLDEEEATFCYLGWRTTENAPLRPDVAIVCNNVFGEPAWIWPLNGEAPPPAMALPSPQVNGDGGDEGAKRIRIKAKDKAAES